MSVQLTAEEIASATGGALVRSGARGPVLSDTRVLTEGCWFLAIRGDRFDGHDFLSRAWEAGARGCIVDREVPEWPGAVVRVTDTVEALQQLGRAARRAFKGPVVGLTGSSGKTTTRTLIALALRPLGSVHHTVGNLNNHLGVPMTLLAHGSQDLMVVEMGTSSPGEIAALCEIATPTVRLIVNVGPAHLQELGGLAGVAQEKGALFASSRPGDVVVVNLDDPWVRALPVPEGVRRVSFGEAGDVELLEAQLVSSELSMDCRFRTPEGEVSVRVPAPGRHVALDAAAALAVAWALGAPMTEAAAALGRYEAVGMRLRPEVLPCGAVALNDAYNANPQSMEASLELLASLPGRRVAVLGDMLEMGAEEAAWHERIAAKAGTLGLDLVVLVGPRMAAALGSCAAAEVRAYPEAAHAVAPLAAWLGAGDHVLFKGSRGARVERVLQGLRGE